MPPSYPTVQDALIPSLMSRGDPLSLHAVREIRALRDENMRLRATVQKEKDRQRRSV